jgi:translation elongation factor EF-4
MAKSRKRKSVKKLKQVIPVQQFVTVIREDNQEPVIVKVKSNRNRVVRHKPGK